MSTSHQAAPDESIPALVRAARAARGLTQDGLARELGVSFITANAWERGRAVPDDATLARLRALAGVDDREPPPESGEVATATRGGAVATAQDRAAVPGWPPNAKERRDFHHQPREFPGDVATWRAGLVDAVRRDTARFPAAAHTLRTLGRELTSAGVKRDDPAREQATTQRVRDLVDDGIAHVREVARFLAMLHGTPDLGNKQDPLDELVYIILSRKTREDAYQLAYDALKRRFRSWDQLLDAAPADVEALLASSGLADKKTSSLFGALTAIRDRFGTCTLEPLRDWPDHEVESFLCSLPEVSRKSAYCVMMYALGRAVFPVDTHVGRVLGRIGLYRELGLSLDGLDHKQLQAELADLIPPNLRYSLHVNLVAHGRDVCRAPRPACERCELRLLCRTARDEERARVESLEQPRMADLFCGAGGVSEGFERSGFSVAFALDMDAVALRTYRLNHPAVRDDRIVCTDIRTIPARGFRRLAGPGGVQILVGAPPCQGFSHVGHRSKTSLTGYDVTEDERNYLYESMIAAAVELRPRLFLMENVPGMHSARKGDQSFLDTAAHSLEAHGFATAIWRVNAAAYGVPQDRVRMFLVAAKGAPLPQRPEPVYQDGLSREFDAEALPPVTLDEAIFDLPPREADEGNVVDAWPERRAATNAKYRRYLAKFGLLSRSRFLFNHTVRYHNARDLELYALLQPGEDSVHALERYGRDDLMRYRTDVFDDKYARLRGDRPCKTIVAHLAKDGNGYIHPTQARSLSFREAARVQSFRDDYVFCGSPSDQWVHLGNAVPPVLSAAIARSFQAALKGSR